MNKEVGLKATFLDGRLIVNGAAFRLDWKDQQGTLRVTQSGVQVVDLLIEATVGDIEINGFELEVTGIPLDNLQLSGAFGLMDSSYSSVTPEAQAQGINEGDETADVPDWSATLSARYATTLADGGAMDMGIDYAYRDELLIAGNSVGGNAVQDGYGLLNANISYESPQRNWRVNLWGKNLTDEDYVVFQTADSLDNFTYQALRQSIGAPTTYGIDVRYSF